jgi:glycosyltransferase involved in cell wall biosynthesis
MKENIPLKEIPLPDYHIYRKKICDSFSVTIPLKSITAKGLKDLPEPLNRDKKGWPWDKESDQSLSSPNSPKISVVIPSFQQGRFIEEAIRSVLLQNYPAVELIIIDGGSTDETSSIVKYYSEFVSLFISEKDRGQSEAINKGFSMASGDLYYWLNSDDYLNINSFNKVIPHFIKDKKLDIIYGDGYTFDEQTQKLSFDMAPLVLQRYLRFGGIVLSHSVIWRKNVHCPIWEDLNCAMDAELWLRLFTGPKFKHSHYPIGIFRKHAEQKSSDKDTWTNKWKADYENYIWKWYPAISNWKLRVYEYRVIQNIVRKFRSQKDKF